MKLRLTIYAAVSMTFVLLGVFTPWPPVSTICGFSAGIWFINFLCEREGWK